MSGHEHIRVAIAGGGTGGHLFPALNLGKAMEKAWQAELLFFGTERGIEKNILPKEGYTPVFLPVRGFQRKLTAKNLLFPYYLWRSLALSKKALRRFKPHVVLGTGGYVMGPVLKSAKKLGIPIVIQEQNSYPGVTTRMLAKEAEYVFLAYEEAKKYLPAQARTVVTGNPIRLPEEKISREEARAFFGLQPDRQTILVMGGSQGAENINRAVMAVLENPELNLNVQWLWQTGKSHFEKWQRRVKQAKVQQVTVAPFITEMFKAYRAADLVICRAGAMTLSELMALGKPAILIPYPFAAANHQFKNAAALAQKGAALIITDSEQLPENLQQTLKALLQAPEKIEDMAKKMRALYPGNSIEKILRLITEVLRKQGITEI